MCHRPQFLFSVSVMETTARSLLGWPIGILEPEPSSWTPYPTPSTSTSLGTSSLLSRPTMIITTTTFITSTNRITHKGYISVFTSASPTTYFIYLFFLSVWPDSEPSAPTPPCCPSGSAVWGGGLSEAVGPPAGDWSWGFWKRPYPVPHTMGRRTGPAQTKETVSHCFPTQTLSLGQALEGKLRLQGWPTQSSLSAGGRWWLSLPSGFRGANES